MFTLVLIGGVVLLSLLVHAFFLSRGARWFRLPRPAFWRSLIVYICHMLILIAVFWFVDLQAFVAPMRPWLVFASSLIVTFAIGIGLIKIWHGGSFGRLTGAWAVSLIASGMMIGFVYLVSKPYLLGFYTIPTGSMSPSVRGPWSSSTCPKCGGNLVLNMPETPGSRVEVPAICESCFHADLGPATKKSDHHGDRIICNLLKKPNRWDVVCFRMLNDEQMIYAKRVIGLPGEELWIADDAVWINGQKQQPPKAIGPIRYVPPEDHGGLQRERIWGEASKPVTLGADEYFLLGDNTQASADSRNYGPIKANHLLGVAEVIYFPFERVRILP